MKTPGYMMRCDNCGSWEFFEEDENYLDGDWYDGIPGTEHGGGHMCDDCWNSQENTRDEQAKLAQAEDDANWERLDSIPYSTAVRESLLTGGGKNEIKP